MTDELKEARTKRANKQLADTVLKDLGGSAEELAEMVDGAPDQIREAILDGLERAKVYEHFGQKKAALDEAEGIPGDQCCNMVCSDYQQAERTTEKTENGSTFYMQEGKMNYCKRGVRGAQSCMFRMKEHPPSNPFERIPGHREAVHMLMRAGLLNPDEFGHFNGTAFAQYQNTNKLWFRYLQALKDLKKLPETIAASDWGEIGDYAKKLVKGES